MPSGCRLVGDRIGYLRGRDTRAVGGIRPDACRVRNNAAGAIWLCALYIAFPLIGAYLVFLRREVVGE